MNHRENHRESSCVGSQGVIKDAIHCAKTKSISAENFQPVTQRHFGQKLANGPESSFVRVTTSANGTLTAFVRSVRDRRNGRDHRRVGVSNRVLRNAAEK